jgi:hypothetical protein
MSPSLAIAPIQSNASQALLRERLTQLESVLLEARGRVMLSFDRELATIRSWMDSLEHFNPSVGLQALDQPTPTSAPASFAESVQELLAASPQPAAKNIVPFTASIPDLEGKSFLEEPPLDPALASATIDELNAALAAAFAQMSEQPAFSVPRSA